MVCQNGNFNNTPLEYPPRAGGIISTNLKALIFRCKEQTFENLESLFKLEALIIANINIWSWLAKASKPDTWKAAAQVMGSWDNIKTGPCCLMH